MRHTAIISWAIVLIATHVTTIGAFEQEPPLDLSGMATPLDDDGITVGDMPVELVDWKSSGRERRWYVSGIIGASFASLATAGGPNADPNWNPATFSGTANDTLFTGGGAIGMAVPRPSGAVRVEFEGKGRDLQDGTEAFTIRAIDPGTTLPNEVQASDGWTTMANVWRDIRFTERGGAYLGGGIGGGGYRAASYAAFDIRGASTYSCEDVAGFAWQAGAGIFYNLSDRIALDLGYRFMAIAPLNSQVLYDGPYFDGTDVVNVIGQPYGTFTTAFSTSELLLSIRIYEPFRRWR